MGFKSGEFPGHFPLRQDFGKLFQATPVSIWPYVQDGNTMVLDIHYN